MIPNTATCNNNTGLNVCINGVLGPILGGSGGITSGTYTSTTGSVTGSGGQNCTVTFGAENGGNGGTALVTLTGTNAIAPGTILLVQTPGSGYTTPPTTAALSNGTATCSGTATVTTKLDDPLALNGIPFLATTTINPQNVIYNASTETYNGVTLTFTSNPQGGGLTLSCSGATVTVKVNDSSDGNLDTLAISNCTFHSILTAAFTAKIAIPAGTLPAPLPLPFSGNIVTSPATASQGTYTITSGSFGGVSTTLGIGGTPGTVSAVCTGCTAEPATPTSLTFSAPAGGTATPQNVTVGTSSPNEAYAVTESVTSPAGGTWLSVGAPGSTTTGGQTGGSFAVNINTAGLVAGTYTGTVSVYTSTSTSPQAIPVTLNITASTPALTASPTSMTFTSSAGAVPAAQNLSLTSTGAAIPYTVAASTTTGGSWLAVSATSGTTPGSVSVSISSTVLATLATGTYSGTVTVTCNPSNTCSNTGGKLTVPVTLNVTAAMAANPTSLTFNYTVGGSVPSSQPVAVSSNGGAISYTAAASTTSGGGWLAVAPTSGTTPSSVSASLNSSVLTTLAAGTYNGTVTLSSTGATNSPLTVPVTLHVTSAPNLILSPTSLTFSMVSLGSVPSSQPVSVTSSGAALTYTTAVSTTTGGSWLSASAGATTPGTVTVSILANTLAAGTYTGTVTVSSTGASNSPQTVGVTLTVTAAATLGVSPSSLSFSYQTGGSTPGSQPISVTSSSGVLNFTAAASTSSGGGWLAVSPTGSTATPATVTVSLVSGVLSGLAAGTYQGSVTITSAQAGNSPVTVPVTLTVSNLPSLTATPPSMSFSYTAGGTVPASQTTTIGSTGAALSGVAAVANQPWLAVSPSGTTTPVTLTVSLVQSGLTGLTPGVYNGTITVSATGAAGNLTYPVTLTVAAQPSISVSPTSLTFSGQVGGSNPASKTLALTITNGPVNFTAAAATTSGGPWLSVTPTSGNASATLTVAVNTSGLAAGTYNGSITVTANGASGSPAVIPVTLTVAANILSTNPTSISMSYSIGGTVPSTPLAVSSSTAGLSFTAAPGASWLTVSPTSGTTPGNLTVSINPAGLTAQTYNSSVTITASGAGNSPLVVPVTLVVSNTPSLIAQPTSLSFSYVAGGPAPVGQPVAISTSNAAAASYTVTAATTTGGAWLKVSPTSGTSPSSVTASLNTAVLTTAGTFSGTLTISATGFTSTTVPVTVVVTQPQAVIQVTGTTSFSLANTAAPITSPLNIAASDQSAQAFSVTLGTTGFNWLSVSPTSGTTPATVTMTINPAGLLPGTYIIPLTVSVPSLPIPTKTVQITLVITGSNLAASPSSLSFNYQIGNTPPPTQPLAITVVSGTGTVALTSVTSNVPWLTVTNATSAPTTLQVGLGPGLTTPGTFLGAILIRGVGAPNVLEVAVTVTVTPGVPLTVAPTSLTFAYQIGGANPAAQSINVSAGSSTLNFTATSPGSWVTLNPTTGTTPGTISVTVNPAGLGAGTYTGTINVSAPGSTGSVPVAVTLTITGPLALTIAPSTLSFAAPTGGPAPSPQTLSLTSNGAPLSFTAGAGSIWLSVTPTSGTTPATLTVSVNPAGLQNGTYNGTVNITQAGSSVPQMVIVTLQVGQGVATPTIAGVINAASGVVGNVSPGMAVSIFGSSLGPATGVGFTLPSDGSSIATTLGGTQVLFDGVPVPILYSSAGQVNAMAPFGINGKPNTTVQVVYSGGTSAGSQLTVMPAEPGLFTANGGGNGQGAILNQDYGINSSTNPAAAGSYVMLYGTGGGLTDPASIDGMLNPITDPPGTLLLPVTATVANQSATVQWFGPAPGLVAGIIQVNIQIPDGTPSGDQPVVISINNVISQMNVTVAVQ